jgi:PTS system nitrogen regulatory IIA component
MPDLADVILPGHIAWLETTSKEEALNQLLSLLSLSRAVKDPTALRQAVFAREVLMSTGVGYGVAIPHAKIPTVESFVVAIGIVPGGIAFGSTVDDDPVRLIVMIAGPARAQEGYLKLLSTLMRFIKSEKGRILSSTTAEDVAKLGRRYPLDLPPEALPASADRPRT